MITDHDILSALDSWIPDSDVYLDEECPVTEPGCPGTLRSPISWVQSSRPQLDTHTVDGVTVLAHSYREAVSKMHSSNGE